MAGIRKRRSGSDQLMPSFRLPPPRTHYELSLSAKPINIWSLLMLPRFVCPCNAGQEIHCIKKVSQCIHCVR